MLRYLSSGKRYFGKRPMPPHRRVNWEFIAVVGGEIAPVFPHSAAPAFARQMLWIFSPTCSHGWVGKKNSPSEVVVFHFNKAPSALEQVMPASGYMAIPLSKDDEAELIRLNVLLQPHYWKPTIIGEAYGDKVLAELTLLCLRDHPESCRQLRRDHDFQTILKVEEWMQTHISNPPTVAGAAKAAGISESNLYRLFQELRKMSPQQAIIKFKVDHAMDLIAKTECKLDEIASQCGFSNASALCRAFKRQKGCSPKAWHREIFIQYKRPSKGSVLRHTQHGERCRAL